MSNSEKIKIEVEVDDKGLVQGAQPAPGILLPPVGWTGIVREFGDIRSYIGEAGMLDPRWEMESLAKVALPFDLALSWDHSKTISSFRCHRRLTQVFRDVFDRVQKAGLQAKLRSFGGCYMYRPQRARNALSTHSWGIAIDLNPETNVFGTSGDMDLGIVRIFRDAGFTWGGGWASLRSDPMHFQFCSGY